MSDAATVTTQDLAQLETLQKDLKEKRKAVKQAKAQQAWEEKIKARNPAYVLGSLRQATPEDEANLGHCHGQVCDVACSSCQTVRTINKQDAFQVKYCKDCRTEARKATQKAKRAAKKLEGKSPEQIQAEIDELETQLEELN